MAQARHPPAPLSAPPSGRRTPPAAAAVVPGAAGRVVLSHTLIADRDGGSTAVDALAAATGLPKLRIKDAMAKGAVWLQRGTRKPQRLRRVTTALVRGDRLSIHYDSAVLSSTPPRATLVADCKRYSVWQKPAGLLVEGSRFGDHATLARQIEEHFAGRREVHLVHRLDLEASGLVIAAHSSGATAKLAALFQQRAIDKRYRVTVRGAPGPAGHLGRVDLPLDGKSAVTEFRVETVEDNGTSLLEVRMLSGRYHQIRRHLAALGHPVMGDPRYGSKDSRDPAGLQLAAIGLRFTDPWRGEASTFGECAAWPT